MAILDLPVFAALKGKMLWHQTRQTLLAENVAIAATPGYRGRDLEAYSFAAELSAQAPMTTVTDPRHFRVGAGGTDSFATAEAQIFEVTPSGNAVTLEDEMMKVTSNQLDYQAATTLYARSIKLIRTALGRAG